MTKKSTKQSSAPKAPIEVTLESLLDVIISEYIQTTTVPSGTVESGVQKRLDGSESLSLIPLCHWQAGCPQNLFDFMSSSANQMEPNVALQWWSRTRLRYSCSTVAATFVRFMVPHMKTIGLIELFCQKVDRNIVMDDLEIFTLMFIPDKKHHLILKNPLLMSRTETVEAELSVGCCSHNVLKCRTSGLIIDTTLGQFLGTMRPYIFHGEDEFFSHFPGQVVTFYKTRESEIDVQVGRDNNEIRTRVSPDCRPARFTKRVFRSYQNKKDYCWNCKGGPSIGSALKRCTKCKIAMYCSRECQALDWKRSHKTTCASATEN